jgi:hypothetical protein
MQFPEFTTSIERQRIARSIKQLRPGDIVECWLDCIPESGKSRPLPIIICEQPGLNEPYFIVKNLFGENVYPLIFMYQWRKVGHIKGFTELWAQERHPAYLTYSIHPTEESTNAST